MLVALDANVIVANPYLRGPKWDSAAEACVQGQLKLVVPESVILECVEKFKSARHVQARTIKKTLARSSVGAREIGVELVDKLMAEGVAYEGNLRSRLAALGAVVPDEPTIGHLVLVQRALQRVPPFNEAGGGYRDTLLWFQAMSQISEPPFQDLTLVSKDSIFVKNVNVLDSELEEETGGRLTVATSIDEVDFPGEFIDVEFEISDAGATIESLWIEMFGSLNGLDVSSWFAEGSDGAYIASVHEEDVAVPRIEVKQRYRDGVFVIKVSSTVAVDVAVYAVWEEADGSMGYGERLETCQLDFSWSGESLESHGFDRGASAIYVSDVRYMY